MSKIARPRLLVKIEIDQVPPETVVDGRAALFVAVDGRELRIIPRKGALARLHAAAEQYAANTWWGVITGELVGCDDTGITLGGELSINIATMSAPAPASASTTPTPSPPPAPAKAPAITKASAAGHYDADQDAAPLPGQRTLPGIAPDVPPRRQLDRDIAREIASATSRRLRGL